ncbi:TPA: hypothetical protein DEP21_00480 [Patescibacteria group bacterium]|nr:hypothetical protein [Candidatus Gracilibacteria bacterium]
MIGFLRNVYANAPPKRYDNITHKLRYHAISSNVLLSSLSADRRNNFIIPKKALRKKVIIRNIIKSLCFLMGTLG